MGSVMQQALLDAQAFGVGVTKTLSDGSVVRIDPMEVFEMAKGGKSKPKPKPRPKPRPTGY